MKITRNTTAMALATACVSLAATAPLAIADQPATSPNGPKATKTTPNGPKATTPKSTKATTPTTTKRRAYGVLCKGQSKKHVKGQKGTPFSQCVTAMAKADRNEKMSARRACKVLSKKHVKGQKGTPFSQCVKAAAKQRKAAQAA